MRILSSVLWFAVLVLLMHGLRDVYGPLLRRRVVKLVVAPGVVVFLFFKILACWAAGAKVREIKPFDDKSDLLQHEKPGLGAVGEFLIGALPLGCLLLAFVLLFSMTARRGFEVPALPFLPVLWNDPVLFAAQIWDFLSGFFRSAARFAGGAWFWALFYAAVNVLLAGAPSLKDLKHVAIAVAIAALCAAGLSALKIRIGSPQAASFLGEVGRAFVFLLGSGLTFVFVSVLTVGVWRLFLSEKDKK